MISVLDIPLKSLSQNLIVDIYKNKLPFRLENGELLHYEGSLQAGIFNRPASLFPAFGTAADKVEKVYKIIPKS